MSLHIPGGMVIHSDDIHIWTDEDVLHIGHEKDVPEDLQTPDGSLLETHFQGASVEEMLDELEESDQ